LPALAIVLLSVVTIVTVWQIRVSHAAEPQAQQHLPSPLPPAPAQSALTIGSGSNAIVCPTGSMPTVILTAATFDPRPANGSDFLPGTYHVSLSGNVANDTTAAITVESLTTEVDGQPWAAAVSGPWKLGAGEMAPVTAEGTYVVADGPQRPAFGVDLDWQWRDVTLIPCGNARLISDD